MATFRKKPVEIEAFQWTGGPAQIEDPLWICAAIARGDVHILRGDEGEVFLIIDTLEGRMSANPGDWIIKGVKNELYPCKPDIFAATYEPA